MNYKQLSCCQCVNCNYVCWQVLGPMRVQLLHPVSRHKRVQSLQHLCRWVAHVTRHQAARVLRVAFIVKLWKQLIDQQLTM